ncbi:MAG: hypothetical protein ACK4FL_04240 [Microgenomates group bacterium]
MRSVEEKIRYLSPRQLRALFLLAKSEDGIISSVESSVKIGVEGKGLGAIFSSLIRHKFSGESLLIPWGKDESGRGLRFKLNEKLISKEKLLAITRELLS